MAQSSIAVSELQNIGKTVANRLNQIGIMTKGDLERVGSVSAYCEMKQQFPEVRLPLCYYLYSLEGALTDKHWDNIGTDTKRSLREKAERFTR